MIWQLDLVLLGLTVVCAIAAVSVRDLLASVVFAGGLQLIHVSLVD